MPRDIDLTAECGVWECEDCAKQWYPMELKADWVLHGDICPKCLGQCYKLSTNEGLLPVHNNRVGLWVTQRGSDVQVAQPNSGIGLEIYFGPLADYWYTQLGVQHEGSE